jgi:GWxTD domain-containing protein
MKKIVILIILIISSSLIQAQSFGKRLTKYGFEVYVKPSIYYDTYFNLASDKDKPIFNFVIRIQNDLLQFTKVNNNYKAGYEIALSIKDGDTENTIFTEIWDKSISVTLFDQTNSTTIYQIDHKTFDLNAKPGVYDLILDVTDTGSEKVYKSNRKLTIAAKTDAVIEHNEVKLLSKNDSLSAEIPTLNETPLIEFDRDVISSFDLIADSKDSISIQSSLKHPDNGEATTVQEKKYKILPDKSYYRFSELISKNLLREGPHTLRYKITIAEESIDIKKDFNVVWYKKPVYLYETELAIRPLKYILETPRWKQIDDMPYQEQRAWFVNYWHDRDPTPETPLNEIQYEFYFRVDQANRDYSLRFKEGWETDRGYALILYGEPSKRDLYRYVTHTKPYEIWFYRELNKKLTFIDVDKDDDYKLIAVEELEERINE